MRTASKALAGLLLASAWLACNRPSPVRRHVTIAVPYEIDTLDPHARDQTAYNAIAAHFYEPLVSTDGAMQIRPCLATRWDNPDPSTWIFHLRPGVRFHSGAPLSAADVVFTFQRLLRAPTLQISGYIQYVSEVTALDAGTVRIRTVRPVAVLLNKLRFIGIVPAGSTDAQLRDHPVGTGPYRLAAFSRGEIRMNRNDDYWGAKPRIAEVVFHLDRTADAAIRELVGGEADLAQCNTRRLEPLLQRARKFRIARRTSLMTVYMSYDLARDVTPHCDASRNPFRHREVRQAIDMAIDRREVVSRLTGAALPAAQLVPPFIFGFNPNIVAAPHDPSAARRLLAEAGFPRGFTVEVNVRKVFAEGFESVQRQLERVGIHATGKLLGASEFYALAERRDISAYVTGFACPTGDASDLFNDCMHTRDPGQRFGLNNYSGYSRAELDHRIEDSARLQEGEQRRLLLQQIMTTVMDDLVWIPLYLDENVYGIERSLQWVPRADSYVLAAEIG